MAKLARDFATRFLRSPEPLPFCAHHCLKIARDFDPNLALEDLAIEADNLMKNWAYTLQIEG